jgi:hypothetical protein
MAQGCLSNANIVYYRLELCATGRSLVKRSPTECVCVFLSLNEIGYNNKSLYLELLVIFRPVLGFRAPFEISAMVQIA